MDSNQLSQLSLGFFPIVNYGTKMPGLRDQTEWVKPTPLVVRGGQQALPYPDAYLTCEKVPLVPRLADRIRGIKAGGLNENPP